MNGIEERLKKCFSLTFPGLDITDASCVSKHTVAEWDSLATVSLLSLVEEEFNIAIPAEDVEEFVSFEQILNLIHRKCDATGAP